MFKKFARMGLLGSKSKRHINEATSNSSLSNLRYVITERPKWKVFHKKEVVAVPAYQTRTGMKSAKACPCGNSGPCKQKITPKGVTIHYPQKKKRFCKFTVNRSLLPSKPDKGFYNKLKFKPKEFKLKPKGFKIRPKEFKFKPKGFKIRPKEFKFKPKGFKIRPKDLKIKPKARRGFTKKISKEMFMPFFFS